MGSGPLPAGGWPLRLTTHTSPNCGPRRDGARPDIVVIHYTAMQSAEGALKTLCNPATEVSAHYLIAEDGEVLSLVPEDLRAWHVGAGAWGSVRDVNSRSIGIELANPGNCPFSATQMDALEELLTGIKARWNIRPERVIGHSDMAPGRKIDPGARFDWLRLARGGFAVWPDHAEGNPATFAAQMKTFGYTATDDADLLLKIFRLRFRAQAKGPLDATDAGMISDLAKRFPVDVNAAWV